MYWDYVHSTTGFIKILNIEEIIAVELEEGSDLRIVFTR